MNGKENDNEINSSNFELRQLDTRLGRWWSRDPYNQHPSPYAAMNNNPIANIDPDGGRDVYYDSNGNHTETKNNNWWHNLWHGTQRHWGGVGVSEGRFWELDKLVGAGGKGVDANTPTIRPYEKNSHDKWQDFIQFQKAINPAGAMANQIGTSIANDAYVTAQSPFKHSNTQNLDGSFATRDQRQMGFINTASIFLPSPKGFTIAGRATLGEAGQGLRVFDVVMDGGLPGSSGAFLGGSRLSVFQMEALTVEHGVEFAQVYSAGLGKSGGGGFYTLYSGTRSAVSVPLGAGEFLINHTHPGGTTAPSIFDINYLRQAQIMGSPQKSSAIIPVGNPTTRFSIKTPANGIE